MHTTLDMESVVVKEVEVEIDVVVIQYRRNLPSLPPSTPSSDKLFVADDSTEDPDMAIPSKSMVLLFLPQATGAALVEA